jgi:hypothetical protein
MATVVISAHNVANFPDGGGHFWVYMQYAQALRLLGCDVYWLEKVRVNDEGEYDRCAVATFLERMERYGLGGKAILYTVGEQSDAGNAGSSGRVNHEYIGMTRSQAEAVFARADLLLNFHYTMDAALLSCFRRTALVDIDPGLLQFWMDAGQLRVGEHDFYFTIGETVGTPAARFPDCGLPWHHIRPAVCLELWPYVYDANSEAFTTISSWWSGASGGEYLTIGDELYDNNKRVSFLQFVELQRMTSQPIELALYLSDWDGEDRSLLESYGWRVRHSTEVTRTPEMYQSYIWRSRGEFSCVKPSCMLFQNAWISDRTLCYLASGKPVVVQDTGPSAFLPNGEGMFRFSTIEEAADALAAVNADYERHCRAAREIAETYFDARQVAERILSTALE